MLSRTSNESISYCWLDVAWIRKVSDPAGIPVLRTTVPCPVVVTGAQFEPGFPPFVASAACSTAGSGVRAVDVA